MKHTITLLAGVSFAALLAGSVAAQQYQQNTTWYDSSSTSVGVNMGGYGVWTSDASGNNVTGVSQGVLSSQSWDGSGNLLSQTTIQGGTTTAQTTTGGTAGTFVTDGSVGVVTGVSNGSAGMVATDGTAVAAVGVTNGVAGAVFSDGNGQTIVSGAGLQTTGSVTASYANIGYANVGTVASFDSNGNMAVLSNQGPNNSAAVGVVASNGTAAGATVDSKGNAQLATYNAAGTQTFGVNSATGAVSTMSVSTYDSAGKYYSNVGDELSRDRTAIQSLTRGVNKAYEGTALALAIQQPVFLPGQTFAVRLGWGDFESQNGFGLSAAGLVARDVLGAGSTMVLDAGVGVGGTYNTVAGKAGVTFGFGNGYSPLK